MPHMSDLLSMTSINLKYVLIFTLSTLPQKFIMLYLVVQAFKRWNHQNMIKIQNNNMKSFSRTDRVLEFSSLKHHKLIVIGEGGPDI